MERALKMLQFEYKHAWIGWIFVEIQPRPSTAQMGLVWAHMGAGVKKSVLGCTHSEALAGSKINKKFLPVNSSCWDNNAARNGIIGLYLISRLKIIGYCGIPNQLQIMEAYARKGQGITECHWQMHLKQLGCPCHRPAQKRQSPHEKDYRKWFVCHSTECLEVRGTLFLRSPAWRSLHVLRPL